MNTEIRLFNSLGDIDTLQEFLEDFTYDEVQDYLLKTFSMMENEVEYKMNPMDSITLMFDLASILWAQDQNSDVGSEEFKSTIKNLLLKKTQDYNADRISDPSFRLDDKRTEYFPFGHWSYLQMIWVKLNRIKTVNSKGGKINYESINDSLIDLGSYLLMYYSFCDELDT